MKANKILAFLLVLILVAGFTGQAQARPLSSPDMVNGLADQFVIGDNYTLKKGETLQGNLWVMGGNATIEKGATVTGNIRLVGGNLVVDGEVKGDIAATGGAISLDDSAVIQGNIDVMGASISRANNAQVDGEIRNGPRNSFPFPVTQGAQAPGVNFGFFDPLWSFISFLFRSFLMAALAVLAVMFLPRQVERTAQAAIKTPVIAGGLGLLTVVVVPLALILMMITLILIPVSLLGIFLLGILILFGWVSIGMEAGQRIAQLFHKEWTLPVTTGLGTFTLSVILGAMWNAIPCVGWVVPTIVALVGLGAVILTRLGTQPYPPYPYPPARTAGPVLPPSSPYVTGIYPSQQPPVSPQDQPPFVTPEL